MSNLAVELEAAEREMGCVPAAEGLAEARAELVTALIGHRTALYHVAEALSRYRRYFKAEHTWTNVLDRIAAARGCSAKTLSRLLNRYDGAQELGQLVVDEMLEEHIDPCEPRNRPVVELVAQAPKPATREEAAAAVKTAHANLIEMKNSTKNGEVAGEPQPAEQFADRLLRLVEPWYRAFSLEERDDQLRYVLEKLVNTLRSEVHTLRRYSRPSQVRKAAVPGVR